MGIDKSLAEHGMRRIPERTLLAISVIGGAFGVVGASELFRHKTRSRRFLLAAYAAMVAWLLLLVWLEHLLGPPVS
jgi:uncharacterized membrane protein YsdA (DUF1294 family)